MSVILFVRNFDGDMAVACDSASLVGDWRVPGGMPKMWTTAEGSVVVGACGNKLYNEVARTCFKLSKDWLTSTERVDENIRSSLSNYARKCHDITDKRHEDGTLCVESETIIIVPVVNRVYYITGLCLTVIDLTEATPYYAIGLGSGGVAAQAAATVFADYAYVRPEAEKEVEYATQYCVKIACEILSSCALPTVTLRYDKESGKWVQ